MRISSLLWGWSVVPTASSFVRAVGSLFVDGTAMMRIIGEGSKVAVGNGSRAQFWNDRWIREMPLKRAFPRIFALASKKEGTMSEFGRLDTDEWIWDVPPRRRIFGWETKQWNRFEGCIERQKIRNCVSDTLAWIFCPNGIFSVSSARRCLEQVDCNDMGEFFLSTQCICPPKVDVFVWQMLKGRTMVRDVLKRFGLTVTGSSLCPFCNNNYETSNHIFLLYGWS
ncbi:hypothetical protein Ddye_013941 [Dipteronia dyeriana]|uniref:Reverse transcriptase zinc-binding domain-containing protein n=1 Tax=Dipteronia dyeriana TaxID=168575 RepID=A0AAE0CK22_9ROSI|nr:hypothetical protein Ddye_013941 [Dipteronia dyeriana]